MKTGRSILISTILALGAAGSILAGSAASAVAAAPASSVVVAGQHNPDTHFYG